MEQIKDIHMKYRPQQVVNRVCPPGVKPHILKCVVAKLPHLRKRLTRL